MIDVSIIIVNYNTCRMTQECIDSIYEKTREVEFEVILVDNASKDGSKEHFSHDSRIHYVYSEKNGGFGYGNNRGMEVAKGKYFFLLNSDTLLKNNAVKLFFDYAESHEPRTVYGCYLEKPDGSYNGSFHFFPAFTINQFIHRLRFGQDGTPTFKECDVECIGGTDLFLPRFVYEECGGFDENIFMYGEDGEWQYRMNLHGIRRMLIPMPKIVHLGGGSVGHINRKNRKMHFKSHFYILRKYMKKPTFCLARLYYFLRTGF